MATYTKDQLTTLFQSPFNTDNWQTFLQDFFHAKELRAVPERLTDNEAKEEGYDEAVMLHTSGFVSEASGENIFMVRNGIIKTTPLTSVLGGITRESVIQVARDLGFTVEEQLFTRDELYIADEAFFTGTAAELTPIREVDRRQIGAGHAGPVTKQLQQAFFEVVKGKNPKYASWLSHYTF